MTGERRKKLKKEIFTRDNFRCIKCGETSMLTIDHIKPQSEGGTDLPDNLQTLCLTCNAKKGNSHKLGFFERLKLIWYSQERLVSFKASLRKEFIEESARKITVQSFDDKMKSVQGVLNAFQSRIDKITIGTQNNLQMVGLENDIDIIKKEFTMLKDFLGIEYAPEEIKEIEEIKIIEIIQPSRFIKKKK